MIWLEDSKEPIEFLANLKGSVKIPGTKYKLEVSEYLPHYSIDIETKEVINSSDEPVNPAIKIRMFDEENSYEQWVWSKFSDSPHSGMKLPLRVEFVDIDPGNNEGNYILTASSANKAWLVFSKEGKTVTEKVELGKKYLFVRKEYSFSIDKIVTDAVVKANWKNESEELLHPAIVVEIEHKDMKQEMVLELNRPFHQETDLGMLILTYKQQQ